MLEKGVRVWGLVVVLMIVGLVFSGIAVAENVSDDLMPLARGSKP